MSLIQCKDAAVGYDGLTVADKINFAVENGDYVCILGENGAGKSTLIKSLLGLIPLVGGSIAFGDGLKQTEIGYLPQQTQIQKDFPASVYEIVLSGRSGKTALLPFYTKKDKHIAMHNMKVLGIEEMKNKCYRELSGGQQQRVLLARALCATGKLLLLDEPITGLDPLAAANFYDVIKGLNHSGISVITVTHDISYGIRDAKKILYISHEKSSFYTKEEFLNSELYGNYNGGSQL